MAASRAERDFMRRIGRFKAASHAEAAARHRALPLRERLRRSWHLHLAGRSRARAVDHDDDPSRFYELARRLGLYHP
jgi:hypothetical protein